MKTIPLLALCLFSVLASTQAAVITLTLVAPVGVNIGETNIVHVRESEVAELLSSSFTATGIGFTREGRWFDIDPARPAFVAGPADIVFYRGTGANHGGRNSYVTFKVAPESFPPDKTIIIPEGTTGARIALECSTNLIHWSVATNGFYTGTNGAKFFRVTGERLP